MAALAVDASFQEDEGKRAATALMVCVDLCSFVYHGYVSWMSACVWKWAVPQYHTLYRDDLFCFFQFRTNAESTTVEDEFDDDKAGVVRTSHSLNRSVICQCYSEWNINIFRVRVYVHVLYVSYRPLSPSSWIQGLSLNPNVQMASRWVVDSEGRFNHGLHWCTLTFAYCAYYMYYISFFLLRVYTCG